MISCVSPSNHSSNHTINTLRYSDRLKEKTSSFGTPAITQVKKSSNLQNNNIVYKVVNSSSSKINNKLTNNKLGISVNNNGIKNNFGLANKTKDKEKEKEKEKQKRDNSETKNENIGKKINNFFDDIEELDEDNMQKLNLKPTPINEPIRKKTYVPKKKNRFALQKKTKTDRAENQQKSNNSNNNINKFKKKLNTENKKEIRDDELLKNKINEEDFDEPKQEKMLINQENEDHYKFKKRDIFKKNNNEKNEIEMENEFKNVEEEENIENREENENENEDFDENINNKNTMMETQTNIPYIIEEQENLISNHMDIIKSEAKLLTEEGNLISKIKGITEENYTMEEYVPKIEDIIETKLKYFKELKQKIKEYKSLLG
jgi:hypothetical protein